MVERGIVTEDRTLDPPKLRSGFQAEFLTQDGATLLEEPQRIRLPSGAIQGHHQLAPETLPEGLVGDKGRELGHDLAMLAELEIGVETVLEDRQAQLLKPCRLS